jgi:two-component sensor histidine kinase
LETAESNHRIANSLAMVAGLLRLQASAAGRSERELRSDEFSALLLEAAGRIEIVGRLHGRLAQGPADFELAEIVQEVAEATVESLARPDQVKLSMRFDENRCDPMRQALPIGLVVGELITNSLKHAHPAGVAGEIEVSCRQGLAGELTIEVTDDGVGLPEGLDPATSEGFGLRLVRALAGQLGGQLSFEDSGVGLMVRLALPGFNPS